MTVETCRDHESETKLSKINFLGRSPIHVQRQPDSIYRTDWLASEPGGKNTSGTPKPQCRGTWKIWRSANPSNKFLHNSAKSRPARQLHGIWGARAPRAERRSGSKFRCPAKTNFDPSHVINRQTALMNDSRKRPAIQLPMHRHGKRHGFALHIT